MDHFGKRLPLLGKKLILFASVLALGSSLPYPASAKASQAEAQPHLVVPGVNHSIVHQTDGTTNQSIHIVRLQPNNPFVKLEIQSPDGKVQAKAAASAIAQQHNSDGHTVVGAVNLDFFGATGVPTGLQITNGEIRTAPNLGRTFFAVKQDGTVQIGGEVSINSYIRTDNGESLQVYAVNKLREQRHTNHAFLYTERFAESTGSVGAGVEVLITPDDPSAILKPGKPIRGLVEAVFPTADNPIPAGKFVLSASGSKASWITSHLKIGTSVTFGVDLDNGLNDAEYAVAGWSGLAKVLLHNGEVSSQVDDSSVNNVVVPNPRTFLATKNGQLYVVTFDGRQPGYADGVTLREGAEYLQSLGMQEAINMDGGGSTTLLLKEPGDEELSLVNLPSDGKERAIGNALLIVSTQPHFGRQ